MDKKIILEQEKFILKINKYTEKQKDKSGKVKTTSWKRIWYKDLFESEKYKEINHSPLCIVIYLLGIGKSDKDGIIKLNQKMMGTFFSSYSTTKLSRFKEALLELDKCGLVEIMENIDL